MTLREVESVTKDGYGALAARFIAGLPPARRHALRRAAFGRDLDGKPRPRVWDSHALAMVGTAMAIWRHQSRTRRRGFAAVTVGVPIGAIRRAVHNPRTGRPYSMSAMCGTHVAAGGRRGALDARSLSFLEALHEAGFFVRQQPRADAVGPDERGPSGYCYNQYWFPSLETLVVALGCVEDDGDAAAVPRELGPPRLARPPD